MSATTIRYGNRYALVSYGNGTAYALQPLINNRDNDVFLQGDDATAFREELDALENAHPLWDTDDVLQELWQRF